MVRRGEEKAEAELVDGLLDPMRLELESEAERFEHIGRPARRRHGTISVFRHRRARGSGDERSGRGDVDRVRAVTARAGRVDEIVPAGSNGEDVVAHRLRAARDLVGCLTLRAQRDQESSDLRRRRFAAHDLVHHCARFRARQLRAVEQFADDCLDHPVEEVSRYFAPQWGEDGFWVELHAVDVQREMTHRHDFAVGRGGADLQLGRDASRGQRVVAPDLELLAEARRRRLGRRGARCRTSRARAPAPARPCRRTPRRSPGARGRRRASACCVQGAARSPASRRRRRDGPGPGEITRCEGASRSAVSPSIASFRRTLTSAPSSPKRCARLYVNES